MFIKQNGNYAGIRKRSSFVIISMAVFMGVVMLISPEILSLLGTKSYADSVYCVIPIVAGGFFAFLYNFPAEIEYYFEKTKFIMFGTMVAAYTTLATYFLYFVFHLFLAGRIFNGRIFSVKTMLVSCAAIFIVTAVCVLFLRVAAVRMVIAAGAVAVFVVYEEKVMGIGKKVLRK